MNSHLRDAHSPRPEVAKPQDAIAVREHDAVHDALAARLAALHALLHAARLRAVHLVDAQLVEPVALGVHRESCFLKKRERELGKKREGREET